jgi:hypothetical protein
VAVGVKMASENGADLSGAAGNENAHGDNDAGNAASGVKTPLLLRDE